MFASFFEQRDLNSGAESDRHCIGFTSILLLTGVRTPPRKTKRAEGLDEFSLVACHIFLCSDWLL